MTQTAITLLITRTAPTCRENAALKETGLVEKQIKQIRENYKSSYEVAAQHILNLIQTDSDIDLSTLKKEISKDYFY
jgi:hypothetical protein